MSCKVLDPKRRLFVRCGILAALIASLLATNAHADLVGDYRFASDLTNSSGPLPSMTPIGTGSASFHPEIVEGTEVTVYEFPTDNGLQITPLAGMSKNAFSIVMLFRFDHVTGSSRLIDFKGGTSDCGFYVTEGAPAIKCGQSGTASICPNTWVQVALTRARNNTVKVYVNGRQVLAYVDDADNATITGDVLRFFRDNECIAPCGEESGGAVSRIRLYDTVVGPNFVEGLVVQECGDLNSSGTITASDALGALKMAVGSGCCQVEFCDVVEPAGVLASDALAILKAAVGQDVELSCEEP